MSTRKRFSKLSAILAIATCSAFAVMPASAADFPAGTYAASGITLAFDGSGHFRVTQNDAVKVEGDYTVDGSQLQVTDRTGPWACTKAAEQKGTYRWKSEGNTLTFNKVADACKDRVGSLTLHPFRKQG
ncbi:MAG: hypothetical protein OJF55_002838 [Rhodanobacteraceae bacterium]|jgi:hypothetical protein|nr:MAG: hypothetical protein OJF55_002838 [Rhodanobacteraceae bacterium]